jgi:hypothetical protein
MLRRQPEGHDSPIQEEDGDRLTDMSDNHYEDPFNKDNSLLDELGDQSTEELQQILQEERRRAQDE